MDSNRSNDPTRTELKEATTLHAASTSPFDSVPPYILKKIEAGMTPRQFDEGALLIRQGDPGESLILLDSGHVEVQVEADGERHVLRHLGPGELVGEFALLTSEPRSASVKALTPVRARVMASADFHQLAREHPRLSVVLTHLMARRLGFGEHDALAGKMLEGYKIEHRLGRGGMAVVYAAEDAEGQRVALKMMSHRLVYDEVAFARFQREADLVESFEHPNIARLHGRFPAFHTYFQVIELCDRGSLDDLIRSGGPIREPVVRRIAGQLAAGLAHAHGAGIVHRDLKPANVLITADGWVKLSDFGLAESLIDLDDPSPRTIVGTPRYMAPEQLAGAQVGRPADVFALGLTIYEMLTSQHLFYGRDMEALRHEHCEWDAAAINERLPWVGAELRRFLVRCLARDPGRRKVDLEAATGWAEPLDGSAAGD